MRWHDIGGTINGNEARWRRVRLSAGLEPLWLGNSEIAADLAREMVVDLCVPRGCAGLHFASLKLCGATTNGERPRVEVGNREL